MTHASKNVPIMTVLEALDRVGGKMESVYLPDGVPASDYILLDNETEALCAMIDNWQSHTLEAQFQYAGLGLMTLAQFRCRFQIGD